MADKRFRSELIELLRDIRSFLIRVVAELFQHQATTAALSVRRTVATSSKTRSKTVMASTAVLTFKDTTGNDASPPKGDGSGLTITFSSDNAAVTLGPATASGDTATATITGTEAFNLSAVVANASGAALVDDDGTKPFVQPTAIAVAAGAAPQAVTAVLSTE